MAVHVKVESNRLPLFSAAVQTFKGTSCLNIPVLVLFHVTLVSSPDEQRLLVYSQFSFSTGLKALLSFFSWKDFIAIQLP